MVETSKANILTAISQKQIDASLRFKQPRMEDVKKNEDLYANKSEPALTGQYSIPLPIMGGFIDTLVSELNQPVRINFTKQETADLKKAKKITAAWEYDSAPTRGKWNIKDLRAKKLAAFSGRAIYKIFSESLPRYKNQLFNVHHYNFVCEPKGGADLENHRFLGEMNYFKSKYDLEKGAESKFYNRDQVSKLINSIDDEGYKRNEDIYNNLKNTYMALGMNPDLSDYTGEKLFSLTEWYMTYEGERYYLLLEPTTGLWLRVELLKDIFKKNIWPYVSWATHDDPNNFWSKAPADDVRPIAISLKEVVDQMFNNLMARMRGKRAIDPNYFPNMAELEDFTTRFVEASVPSGKNLGDGLFEFKTEDNTGITLNLVSFFNSFLGEKTGITPSAQGSGTEDKVGIYFGNLQQVARRMNYYSDFYKQAYAELGLRYLHGLQEHLTTKMSIQMLGIHGLESDVITKEDTNFIEDPDVNITGGADEELLDKEKQIERETALNRAINPILAGQYNPRWLAEQNLAGKWDDSEIKRAMDLDTYGDQEIISEAEEAIQMILKGKDEPKKNRGANRAFLRTILDYLNDEEMEADLYKKILAFFELHVPIARDNAVREGKFLASQAIAQEGVPVSGGLPPAPPGAPSLSPDNKELSTVSPQGGRV